MSIRDLIIDLVALSGGRLIGRTRLQKTVYLLDVQGMRSGAAYYYYNFGPFSDDVAAAISDAKFQGALLENVDHRRSDGSPFSIFDTSKSAGDVDRLGQLEREHACKLLSRLNSADSTVLELAATIHWLATIEKVPNWQSELLRRKGGKTGGGRMEKAAALLSEMGIDLH